MTIKLQYEKLNAFTVLKVAPLLATYKQSTHKHMIQ